ncbi:hypothetical protein SAMN05421874_105154 [Nonomuraea maritima]|uniref:Uncharacterized protein n=1 Tax=Nonomuraea maritima TaxID=683260 RepID=A0A1G8Z7C0_9ACTN|nr:hypothetical protein [Nonomuraea maritima]SDK10976.1 hypothetical protein SAMN05421874_105154 [Nonomuraea maritima]
MNKITVGIVSAVMGGAMLVSGAGAASATTKYDSKLEIRDIKPNPVVVERGKEARAYFDIGASRDVSRVELSVEPAEANFRTLRTKKDVRDLEGWRFSVSFNEHDPAGKWKATAVAYNRFGRVVAKDDAFFSVLVKRKADTRISRFSANPSAVRSGRSIYFTGYLQAEGRSWSGVRGERVSVYYRPTGSSSWKWVTSGTTSWNGKFSLKTRAWKSGTFRTVFSGDSRLDSATSGTDYVRVYR